MFGLIPFNDKNLPARDYFNHLLHGFIEDDFVSPFGNQANAFRVDLRETESEYIVEADLPGIKKDDVMLRYENQYLTIAAKREENQQVKNENYVRKERHYGQFQRNIYIDNVLEDKIEAKFNDGVLSGLLPKRDKSLKRQNIEIQ